jgi:glucose/arabinose dehydrogenase
MTSRRQLRLAYLGLPLVVAALTATACSGSAPAAPAAPASASGTAPASPAGPGSAGPASPSVSATAPTTSRVQVSLTVPSSEGGALSMPHTLTVPPGWTAKVWAHVPGARMEAWTPQGDLLVSQPGSGRVTELRPDASGTAASRTVLSGLTNPQGLAFARLDGRWVLYVGESDQIDRYPWSASGISGSRTVIAAHLPDLDPAGDDVHREKDVAVAADGTVYFDVGSGNNASPADRTSSPERAVIMAVSPQGRDLRIVEKGVRNGEGLAVAPDGSVWTAVNNRDNITYPFRSAYDGNSDAFGRVIQAFVNDHPPDEVVPVTAGRDLGWPYCNPDQDLNKPAGSMADVPFVADAVTNPGDDHLNCAALPRVQVGVAAHSAPLGMSFLENSSIPAPWSGGAVVAVHGSWNRQPPRAPAVLWMAWDASRHTLMPAVTLVGGFQNSDGSRWGRPVDAVPGPDGALYISDDLAGAIYRLVPAK